MIVSKYVGLVIVDLKYARNVHRN